MQNHRNDTSDCFCLASTGRTLYKLDAIRFQTLNLVENFDLTVVVVGGVGSHVDWQARYCRVFYDLGVQVGRLQQEPRNLKLLTLDYSGILFIILKQVS